MLKIILTALTILAEVLAYVLKRKRPAPRVEEVIGKPESPTYSETAKAAAERAADEKFGPR